MDTLKKALRRTDQRRVSNGMEGTRNYKETRAPWIDVDDLIAKVLPCRIRKQQAHKAACIMSSEL